MISRIRASALPVILKMEEIETLPTGMGECVDAQTEEWTRDTGRRKSLGRGNIPRVRTPSLLTLEVCV